MNVVRIYLKNMKNIKYISLASCLPMSILISRDHNFCFVSNMCKMNKQNLTTGKTRQVFRHFLYDVLYGANALVTGSVKAKWNIKNT
jgi:hypothetical protein